MSSNGEYGLRGISRREQAKVGIIAGCEERAADVTENDQASHPRSIC